MLIILIINFFILQEQLNNINKTVIKLLVKYML
jgi:hypothetical protein